MVIPSFMSLCRSLVRCKEPELPPDLRTGYRLGSGVTADPRSLKRAAERCVYLSATGARLVPQPCPQVQYAAYQKGS